MRLFKFLLVSVILGVGLTFLTFVTGDVRSSSVATEFNELKTFSQASNIAEIKTPPGYDRVSLKEGSFGACLRSIKIVLRATY